MNNLTLSNVCLSTGRVDLHDISLELKEGESIGIIGDSAAVNSAVASVITGMIKPDSGTVAMFENPISKQTIQALGYVYSGFPFTGSLTLDDIDSIFSGIYERWNKSTFYGCCHKFSIQKKIAFKGFSAIMQRKLLLAIAVSHATRLLVIDDAFSDISGGMDDEITGVISEFLRHNPLRSMVITAQTTAGLSGLVNRYLFIKGGTAILAFTQDELEKTLCLAECELCSDRADSARYIFGSAGEDRVTVLTERKNLPDDYKTYTPTLEEIQTLIGGCI